MRKLYCLKRIMAACAAIIATVGISGNSFYYTKAGADETDGFPDVTQQVTENSNANDEWQDNPTMDVPADDQNFSQTDNSQTDSQNSSEPDVQPFQPSDDSKADDNPENENDDSQSGASGMDITEYAEKLRAIAEQQAELDKELSKAEKDLKDQTKKTQALQKKIDSVNEEINVLNSYMTALEIKINTNKRKISDKKQEIEEGTENFKQRLRAMYIAGSDSYTTMVLASNSFYDALMRLELIKRVADHDNSIIDNLVKLKNQYEAAQKELEAQQAEYEKQSKELNDKKEKLNELYDTNEDTRRQLARKKKALEAQNEEYNSQKSQYEAGLSGVLKAPTGNTSQDQQVLATMALADAKIEELIKQIKADKKAGKKPDEYACGYTFAWPVPQSYNITYGIGARWGAYHAGLDIGGNHGYSIKAAESGTVLRVNTICPHDYGKDGSCGCGGGYGKYIIIDHGNDFITLYGHLSEVDVLPGDKIKEGDVIGKMGSTGFSTGDHLHFEIRYQGYILNPAYYVDIK